MVGPFEGETQVVKEQTKSWFWIMEGRLQVQDTILVLPSSAPPWLGRCQPWVWLTATTLPALPL